MEVVTPFIEEAASTILALHFFVRVAGVYSPTKTFAQRANFSLTSVPLSRVILLTLVAEKAAGFFHEGRYRAYAVEVVFGQYERDRFTRGISVGGVNWRKVVLS